MNELVNQAKPLYARLQQIMAAAIWVVPVLSVVMRYEDLLDKFTGAFTYFRWDEFLAAAVGIPAAIIISQWLLHGRVHLNPFKTPKP